MPTSKQQLSATLAGFAIAATMTTADAKDCLCDAALTLPKLPERVQPVQLPPQPEPVVIVQTTQFREIDKADLDIDGVVTLLAGKSYLGGERLDVCVEGSADPSQPDSYNTGLSQYRLQATVEAAQNAGLNVVGRFAFGEARADGPDNHLLSSARLTRAYIGATGVFGAGNAVVAGAKDCMDAVVRRNGLDFRLVDHNDVPAFATPLHQANRDGEYVLPVRSTYVPK